MFSLIHFLTLLLKGKVSSLIGGPFALMVGPGSGDGFQSFVNNALPKGVAGDFSGANIRANVVAGSWGFTATPATVLVGNGAWANPATKLVSNYYQPNSFSGFVHREGQTVITNFLGVASLAIVEGDMVTLYAQGDFLGLFTAGATAGQKVYFDPLYGALSSNASGNSVVGANTAGAITSSVLTTTDADQSGSALAVGQIITGAGIPAGTYIASADGTGSGTHLWNLANLDGTAIANVTSQAIANYGVQESNYYVAESVTADCDFTGSLAVPVAPSEFSVLTVTAVASGTLAPGQWLSATGGGGLSASLNVQVLEQLTSTASGGALGTTGTYLVSVGPLVTSTNTFVATQGKLGRISSWL
jgi:phosphotransferase system HPr-like phosphotransfer protein